MSYEEEETFTSHQSAVILSSASGVPKEEETFMSYEEEDTFMSYEEEETFTSPL